MAARKKRQLKTHSVYVVRLDNAVLKVKRFRDRNPQHIPGKLCMYVGMTGKTPVERFQQHLAGVKSGHGFVKKYGRYLLRKKFEHYNPMSYDDAVQKERTLAEDLMSKGYGVWWN